VAPKDTLICVKLPRSPPYSSVSLVLLVDKFIICAPLTIELSLNNDI
jgi:hypothetical protein